MATSKTIAGLIGPTFIAMAVSEVLNQSRLHALVEQAARDPALIYVSGILLFVAGLAIVRVHNICTGWPILVTILGWLFLIGGVARMLLPFQLGRLASGLVQSNGPVLAIAALLFVLGAFLSYKAYSRG